MNSYGSKFKLRTLIFGEIRICSEKTNKEKHGITFRTVSLW